MDNIILPECKLTTEEENLLKPVHLNATRRHSWCDSGQSNSDNATEARSGTSSARTVDSLTDELVSNIMGAVKKMNSEKMLPTHSASAISDTQEEHARREDAKHVEAKLSAVELLCLRLASLQFAALKTLNVLLTSSMFTELVLVADNYRNDYQQNDEESSRLQETVKSIMHNLVDMSIKQCKLKNIVNSAEFERAQSVLHFIYRKRQNQDDFELPSAVHSSVSLETGESLNKRLPRGVFRKVPSVAAHTSATNSNVTASGRSMRILKPPSSLSSLFSLCK